MRIGKILVEAELINTEQLAEGLEYASAKGIFLGKALILLGLLDEVNLERALQAQKFITLGLSPIIAVKALVIAVREQIPLDQGLEEGAKKHDGGHEAAQKRIDDKDTVEQLVELADKFLLDDQCAEAESHYLAAKAKLELTPDAAGLDLATILLRLGHTYMAIQRFDLAEWNYTNCLEIWAKKLPSDSLQTAHAFESLADLQRVMADHEAAMNNLIKALDIVENHLPSALSHYVYILKSMVTCSQKIKAKSSGPLPVGELLKAAGLISEAQLTGALRMSRQSQTPLGVVLRENLMIGDSELQSALKAQFFIQQGWLTEQLAIDLLNRAARRSITLERLLHEAGILQSKENQIEAHREIAAELDKLVACETSSLSSQEATTPIVFKLGTLYEQIGDSAQAAVYYSRALSRWSNDIKGDLDKARLCTSLAKINKSQDKHDEVLQLLETALEHRQHTLGNSHEDTIETMEDLAEAQIECRDSKAAIANLRLVLACREELGQEQTKMLRSQVLLGDGFLLMKRFKLAQTAYQQALTMAQAAYGPASSACAAIVEKIGDLYAEQDLSKTALAQYKYALLILQGTGKGDSKAAISLKEKIEKIDSFGQES